MLSENFPNIPRMYPEILSGHFRDRGWILPVRPPKEPENLILNSWSGDAEKNLQGNFTQAITPGAAPAPAPAPAPAAAPAAKDGKESKLNPNAFMGIGIAAAAIGSALAFITKTLAGMTGLQIWITVIVAILALMLPISIIAIIKLNRQDLSSILEGCGFLKNLFERVGAEVVARHQIDELAK